MTYIRNRTELVLDANRKAAKIRAQQKLGLTDPVPNIYDLADSLNIDVRFWDTPTMEGMYLKEPPTIVISSLRPPGRQAFTCAHELGHHVYNHGVHIDELEWSSHDPDEFLADSFGAALLMPKSVVARGFTIRNWQPQTATAYQIYVVAGWLGVGYTTLIQHMQSTLKMLSRSKANVLRKVRPKSIRCELMGENIAENVIVADEHWYGRAIDIEVGDYLLLPPQASAEKQGTRMSLQLLDELPGQTIMRGVLPGIARVHHQTYGWSAYVRVSRRNYVGRSVYRHLEDPKDD